MDKNKRHMLAKYMYKELVNKESAKLLTFSIGFSLVIGASIYVSSIGLVVVLNSYGIAISSKIMNFISMYIGSQVIYKSMKSLVKESIFADN